MTIPSNVTRNSYTGTGITGPYPVTFKFFEDADLNVTVADTNGVETVKTLTTDYTVTGAGEQAGGSITFTTAVTNGYSIVIEPKADLTQDTDIKNEGGNLRESIEDRFDRLCRDDQVQQNLIDRSVKMQVTDASVADAVLPPRSAGALIGWSDDGLGFANRSASLLSSDATITSAGSTTARWISDRFAEVVNIRDFGAVGDGVTDDADAIQAAIDACPAGGVVHVPKGIFVVSSQVVGKSDITLDGFGTIKADTDIDSLLYFEDSSDVTISGVTLDGNSHAVSCVRWYSNLSATNDLLVKGCTLYGTKNDPGLFFGCIEVASVLGALGPRNNRIFIEGNTFESCGTHGCIIAYSDSVRFVGNVVRDATNHGMEAVDCAEVLIADNTVSNCTISGLGVGTHCIRWSISGNTIRNCGGDGAITCEHNSVNGVISNNVVYDCNGNSGINISYGTAIAAPFDSVHDVVVSGNSVSCKSTVTNTPGVNFYSSTGGGIGVGVILVNNVFSGFNVGISYRYAKFGVIKGNVIRSLTGSNTVAIRCALTQDTVISGNVCDSNTSDHSIILEDYAGTHCSNCIVEGNDVLASSSGTKALVYITGANSHIVKNNITQGSSYYLQCTGAAAVLMSGNSGPLGTAAFTGTGVIPSGNANSTQDIVIVYGKKIFGGTAAPSSGTWSVGDRCLNTVPTVGQPKSWACTSGGTPGTWVSEGNL